MDKFIFIKKGGGEAVYVHDDRISSVMIGERTAPRVSNIKFNKEKQKWVATLLDGDIIAEGNLRNEVIAQEVKELNKRFCNYEYIPGGFHADPPIDFRKSGIEIKAKCRCVGGYRSSSELYYLYINEEDGLSFVVKNNSDGHATIIHKRGAANAIALACMHVQSTEKSFQKSVSYAERIAVLEAEFRLVKEKQIKEGRQNGH
jgi:hypothetical protein